jgi:hypothetical protein
MTRIGHNNEVSSESEKPTAVQALGNNSELVDIACKDRVAENLAREAQAWRSFGTIGFDAYRDAVLAEDKRRWDLKQKREREYYEIGLV